MNVYLGTHYARPSASSTDIFKNLTENITRFKEKGEVIINGDFNARTGKENETIPPDKYHSDISMGDKKNYPKRNSQDKTVNKRGEELIDICKALELLIANGRKIGDPFGDYTCLKWNGNSIVDYLITSKNIYEKIPIFKVGSFSPTLSDHCPLLYTLEITQKTKEKHDETNLKNAPRNFIWNNNETTKFLSNLKSDTN